MIAIPIQLMLPEAQPLPSESSSGASDAPEGSFSEGLLQLLETDAELLPQDQESLPPEEAPREESADLVLAAPLPPEGSLPERVVARASETDRAWELAPRSATQARAVRSEEIAPDARLQPADPAPRAEIPTAPPPNDPKLALRAAPGAAALASAEATTSEAAAREPSAAIRAAEGGAAPRLEVDTSRRAPATSEGARQGLVVAQSSAGRESTRGEDAGTDLRREAPREGNARSGVGREAEGRSEAFDPVSREASAPAPTEARAAVRGPAGILPGAGPESTAPALAPQRAAADPAVQAAGPREPVEAVVQRIDLLATRGGGRARIRLEPAHLGELEITVSTRGSSVDVVVRAEEPAAQMAVLANREQLAEALGSRDLRMDGLSVTTSDREGASGDSSQRSGSGDPDGSGSSPSPRPAPMRGDAAAAPVAAPPTANAPAYAESSIDLRV